MSSTIINTILPDKWLTTKVVKGSGRGKRLGFPTINLDYKITKLQDYKWGVYLCEIKFPNNLILYYSNSLVHFGLLHYGPRATFKEFKPQLEIYIFDFNKNIKAGEKVKFRLIRLIRKTKKFDSSEELVKQIRKDVKKAELIIKDR
ncbi:hypothetical protein A3J78_01235 [Candidatus Beckwithbacteria bacterium RBG_13_35_6]|uniref:riboflavin kinase n=1 Tax=Candidatus Beckwithbacteria bacterium RBG_13_35_6 TaxID=1797456 RepID=A0A1F5DC03_9BACT|nr:MAG: hypothetical protein A3J78_01235 [Candidatus Beckwithbacteria bacterium RBG_13_35_6]